MHIFLIFFPLDGGIAAILNLAMSRGRASTNQTFFAAESVSHFHASRMRRTVWKDQEVMEANENKRRLSEFHCFVFKFRLF